MVKTETNKKNIPQYVILNSAKKTLKSNIKPAPS